MNQRLNYIDRLKGFAIILVVMGHLYFFSYDKSVCPVFGWISSFHMPLFMFLSGFVASIPNLQKLKKLLKRFILPMLVFGLLFTLSFQNNLSYNTVPKVLIDFVMSDSKMGYWYLMSLSVFYCLMFAFNLNKRNTVWIDVLIAACIYVLLGISTKYGGALSKIFCLWNCTAYFPFFIGAYFIKKNKLLQYITNSRWIWIIAMLLYIVLMSVSTNISIMDTMAKMLIIPVLAIISIVYVFVKREHNDSCFENGLSYLGRRTLDIYVLHYFIVYNINLVAFDRWSISTHNIMLSMVVSFLISILVACTSALIGRTIRKSEIINRFVFGES